MCKLKIEVSQIDRARKKYFVPPTIGMHVFITKDHCAIVPIEIYKRDYTINAFNRN